MSDVPPPSGPPADDGPPLPPPGTFAPPPGAAPTPPSPPAGPPTWGDPAPLDGPPAPPTPPGYGAPPGYGPPPGYGSPPGYGPPPGYGYGPHTGPGVSPAGLGYVGGPTPQSNGIATAAMVVGIVSIPALVACGVGGLSGIVAIVLGIVGLSAANKSPDGSGKGMAVTGIVTGALAVLLAIGFWTLVFVTDAPEERFSDVGGQLDEFEEFDSDVGPGGYDGFCDWTQEWQDPDC